MAVGGVGSRADLDEDHRAAVEGHDVDVAAEHPLAAADDPVAESAEILRRFVLAAATEFVAGRRHGEACRSGDQEVATAFLPLPAAGFSATTSSRFSRRRVDLPERSRR